MSIALLLLALAQSPGPQVCPVGQLVSSDTAGHCCWPGQVWSGTRKVCVGVPSCPGELIPSGDACIGASAPPPPPPPMVESEVTCAPDAVLVQGVCCWPGQWVQGGVCVGQRVCPTGTAPVGADCVARGTPPPPGQVPGATQTPAGPPDQGALDAADRYLALNRVFFATSFEMSFNSPITFGLQLNLDFIVYRHPAFSLGLGVGVGWLANWNFTAYPANFTGIAYLPLYAQFGLRLGSTLSEFVVRTGGAPAYVISPAGSGVIGKFLVGGGFIFRWGNSGAVVGFDLYVLNGLAHTITLGFIY